MAPAPPLPPSPPIANTRCSTVGTLTSLAAPFSLTGSYQPSANCPAACGSNCRYGCLTCTDGTYIGLYGVNGICQTSTANVTAGSLVWIDGALQNDLICTASGMCLVVSHSQFPHYRICRDRAAVQQRSGILHLPPRTSHCRVCCCRSAAAAAVPTRSTWPVRIYHWHHRNLLSRRASCIHGRLPGCVPHQLRQHLPLRLPLLRRWIVHRPVRQ